MNTIEPIAWRMQIPKDADVEKAADVMRDRLRKHVGTDQELVFEPATDDTGNRFLVAMVFEREA